MNSEILQVKDLKVRVASSDILHGVNLTIRPGELHAIMGPNGSGKSTLASTLMGHPSYEVTGGEILLDGELINDLSADKRARAGLFLAFQYPHEIEGVSTRSFLRQSYNALHGGTEKQLGLKAFGEHVAANMKLLGVDESFVDRSVNVGFSGGEKKRAEVLQLAVLKPRIAILDEIDSGLDIDALKTVCEGIAQIRAQNPSMAFVLITHYSRMFNYLKPDYVHIMHAGNIIASGDVSLVHVLEESGYAYFIK